MPNQDWENYRIYVLKAMEKTESQISELQKFAEEQRITDTNQKWINYILVFSGSLGGGAAGGFLANILKVFG